MMVAPHNLELKALEKLDYKTFRLADSKIFNFL